MSEHKCRICGEKPAYEDGVCRWESCEAEAAAEEAAAWVRVEYEIMDRELARHEARLAGEITAEVARALG